MIQGTWRVAVAFGLATMVAGPLQAGSSVVGAADTGGGAPQVFGNEDSWSTTSRGRSDSRLTLQALRDGVLKKFPVPKLPKIDPIALAALGEYGRRGVRDDPEFKKLEQLVTDIRKIIQPELDKEYAEKKKLDPTFTPPSRGPGPFLGHDLTPQEFLEILQNVPTIQDRIAKDPALLAKLDKNGNGKLDPDEAISPLEPPPNLVTVYDLERYDTMKKEDQDEFQTRYQTIKTITELRTVTPIFERRGIYWPG